jgi:ATP-dependent DNA helicase RecG
MNEYEVYSYEAFKQKIQDELRVAQRAELSDVYTTAFDEYLIYLKRTKPNLANLDRDKIARLQGFTENNMPTLAGVMLFSDYPQAYFPQLCITAVAVPGEEMSMTGSVGERFIDNKRIDGTLIQMLNEALIFVRRNMKEKTVIDENTGKRTDITEYPVIAIREIILNAIIHRDYSIHTDSTPITITMYSNRIEVENPGGLYGRMTLDKLGKMSADTRNPFIANAFEVMKETENRYSGIPTIINAMKDAGMSEPIFENDRGAFKVTLYNRSAVVDVTSDVENEIMEFCKTPKSRAELEELFKGRITIAYLMNKYVHPMIKQGTIGLTVPNAPKSKNQRYYTK